MKNNLERLKEVVDNLPPFPDMVYGNKHYTEYEMDGDGHCFGWECRTKAGQVAVHDWLSKGNFKKHAHKGVHETIIVYKGKMEIIVNQITHIIKAGECIHIPPDTEHYAFFTDDCWYITVTVPPAKEFPVGLR